MRPRSFRTAPVWHAAFRLLLVCALGAAACAPKKPALPPPAGGAKFPDFVYPEAPGPLASVPAADTHEVGWQWLQAGDLKQAERSFSAALKQTPAFFPAEAGLGYVALARKDNKAAVTHFERAIAADPSYAPALAGRGEALLAEGQREPALASFEAAVAADPRLTGLRNRIAVLRLRGLQDDVAVARRAASAGKLAEAAYRVSAGHRGVTAEPVPVPRAGYGRAGRRRPGVRARARTEGRGARSVRGADLRADRRDLRSAG